MKKINIISFIIALVIVLGFLFFISNNKENCYFENGVLLEQYIDNTTYEGGGNCVNGCLFMKVYSEHIYFFKCGHINKILWENRTFYFANDLYRDDLQKNDKINIKWCYVPKIDTYRIRGIKKI